MGEGVTSVKPGDRVAMYWSTHSEYNLLEEARLVKIEDDNLSMQEAAVAFITTFPLAAIRKTSLEIGESVLIMGLGLLRQLVVKLARVAGAVPIVAVDPVKERREEALKNGADFAFDPFEEGFADKVKEVTNGGANVCIEVTGVGSGLDGALDCMARFGRVALLGCHLIDLILQIHGIPERIIPLNKSTGFDNIDNTDFGMAVLECKNGVSFAKTTDIECGVFLRRQLVVTGTKGMVEVKPLEENVNYPGTITHFKENFDTSWNAKAERRVTEGFDRYDNMLHSFGEMVAGENENPWSYNYEFKLYKIIFECCAANSRK